MKVEVFAFLAIGEVPALLEAERGEGFEVVVTAAGVEVVYETILDLEGEFKAAMDVEFTFGGRRPF